MLAVGSDDPTPPSAPPTSKVSVYELCDQPGRRWQMVESGFAGRANTDQPVHDLAFAPSVGRSYALLAVASSADLRIVTLKPLYTASSSSANGEGGGASDSNHLAGQNRYEVRRSNTLFVPS